MSQDEFAAWCTRQRTRVEKALERWVPAQAPADLGEVLRYAVLDAGKRLRPLLVLASAEAVGGNPDAALRAACAVELMHAYSLIHDDLPCMDNDALRHGKPTVHVRFGEARALLAGDTLQALAFELLTPDDANCIAPAVQARLCGILARAAGAFGMAGGQAVDLASVHRQLSEPELRTMHRLKTGALLQACVRMGAALGEPAPDTQTRAALDTYAAALGLAYQVVDDVLDVTATSIDLGKTAGKDAAASKPTYVALLGLEAAQALAEDLYDDAMRALDHARLVQSQALRGIADRAIHRRR